MLRLLTLKMIEQPIRCAVLISKRFLRQNFKLILATITSCFFSMINQYYYAQFKTKNGDSLIYINHCQLKTVETKS